METWKARWRIRYSSNFTIWYYFNSVNASRAVIRSKIRNIITLSDWQDWNKTLSENYMYRRCAEILRWRELYSRMPIDVPKTKFIAQIKANCSHHISHTHHIEILALIIIFINKGPFYCSGSSFAILWVCTI